MRVRNVATVGVRARGPSYGSSALPLLVALVLLEEQALASGAIPVEDLYAGYLESTLQRGELITEIEIPAMGKRRAAYLKCTTRSADWPAVGVAVVLGDETRIFVSAATEHPTRIAGRSGHRRAEDRRRSPRLGGLQAPSPTHLSAAGDP